jgi:hypothetical protein
MREPNNFITIQLGSDETRSAFVLDVSKICFFHYKPETNEQTAKLVLDFGASQKIFEKEDARTAYQALAIHPFFRALDSL